MPLSHHKQISKTDEQIWNYTTKYLARGVKQFSGQFSKNISNLSSISENWRFPIVNSALDNSGQVSSLNEIVFVFQGMPQDRVELVASFAPLYKKLQLIPVLFEGRTTGFFYYAALVPTRQGFYYRFIKNGEPVNDPVNLQRKTLSNGVEWSYFFTDYYNYTQEFEGWELSLLFRLVNHILPFRSEEAQNFINRFYNSMAKQNRQQVPVYKLDTSVGEVNYITNILARQERHHLIDYKICLSVIDKLFRARNPYVESWKVSDELFAQFYDQVANSGNVLVPDWDYSSYSNPIYFFGLLRRHAITGAFSHPRYGGNIAGAGWNYLHEKYETKDELGNVTGTNFNWQRALEHPLGSNIDYHG